MQKLSYHLSGPLAHPLRETLTPKDWNRIQQVIDGVHENASLEEISAATDVFFDALVAEKQTHEGMLCVH